MYIFCNVIHQHFDQVHYQLSRLVKVGKSSVMMSLGAFIESSLEIARQLMPTHTSQIRPTMPEFNPYFDLFETLDDIISACRAVELTIARYVPVVCN